MIMVGALGSGALGGRWSGKVCDDRKRTCSARDGKHLAATAGWPGDSYPLGATYDGAGTNFGLFSEVAERVELCLFDDDGGGTPVALHHLVRFASAADQPVRGPGQRDAHPRHRPGD